jgi:catechol 2,3-dioxygenase-like lactoylglutathione lyase family enzyme
MIEALSAVTLATHAMARSVAFYAALGFELKSGGPEAGFTSFHAGSGYLNLTAVGHAQRWSGWGRVIFYVDDVDELHARLLAAWAVARVRARRRGMGRALFSYYRSGRARTQLRAAAVITRLGASKQRRGRRPSSA